MNPAPLHWLANIIWHSQTMDQADLSLGGPTARRFRPGYSQLLGCADAERPDFAALAALCGKDEHFYIVGWRGPAPAGWIIEADAAADQFVWLEAPPPAPDRSDIERLDQQHVPQMMALAELTRPGPFAERTIEFGEFFGVLERGRLLAMAGERMHAGVLREVSGVCTHPDAQGQGLAKQLMHHILRRQLARGQTPFLHVMSDNHHARALYERMGFTWHQRVPCRVIRRAD